LRLLHDLTDEEAEQPVLAALVALGLLGLSVTTRSTISHSSGSSEICCTPRRSTIASGASPVR